MMAQAGATLKRRGPRPAKIPRKPCMRYMAPMRSATVRVGKSFAGLSAKKERKQKLEK